ncbi:FemAB family protein [Alienimonas californiensis]|uniref:FemAB family protein n=1 Tax=Alienimonas californiensis TaxID=2527989 RepID=A0A517P487_9PLAN|nr:FemAB family protein [Alienimonas californiensis]
MRRDKRWLRVLAAAFRHEPVLLTVPGCDGRPIAHLPLCLTRSRLFGRFAVALPYVNTAGATGGPTAFGPLIDAAVALAAEYDAKWLELRHEAPVDHPALTHRLSHKVHMRLRLPGDEEALMASFKSKRRSQLRKCLETDVTFRWGGEEVLNDFHAVFAENMRDLGTPVFGRELFAAILTEFDGDAEVCVGFDGPKPVAGALLIHDQPGTDGAIRTAVPSASTLRAYNPAGVNMAMYWQLLDRAVGRGAGEFDFGRSTVDSPTYRFKKQWGAEPHPACWQFHVRKGEPGGLSPEAGGFRLAVEAWKKLPLPIANRLGPKIVRGIP